MDVQADAALEAMAEIAAGAEGATGPSSLPIASSSSSPSKKSSSPSTPSPHDSLSLPPGAAGGSGSADVPEKGYPKEMSESPIEEKFLCGYCQNILRVPQQSECGHRFCKCCLTKMKQWAFLSLLCWSKFWFALVIYSKSWLPWLWFWTHYHP